MALLLCSEREAQAVKFLGLLLSLLLAVSDASAQIPPGFFTGSVTGDSRPLKGDATYCVRRDSGGDQLEMKFEERFGMHIDIRATRAIPHRGVYLLVPEQRDSQLVASYIGRDGRSDPAIPSGRVTIDSVSTYLIKGSFELNAVPDRDAAVTLPIHGRFEALNSCATWAVMAQYDADQATIKRRREAAEARAEAAAARRARAARAARIRAKGWSPRATSAVLAGEVFIGMTKEMVRTSWGAPSDINRTITRNGVHEQWVYAGSYVYFEDGEVTAIQD